MKESSFIDFPKNLLIEIRESRLRSYQSTPGDVEEHRRAKLRVAGDTARRPLIELIQNADDAMQETKVGLFKWLLSLNIMQGLRFKGVALKNRVSL